MARTFSLHSTVKHYVNKHTKTKQKLTIIGNLAQHYAVFFFRGLYILGLMKHAHETTFKAQLKFHILTHVKVAHAALRLSLVAQRHLS